MFGNTRNVDDVFVRDLIICVLDKLESQISWKNRFDDDEIIVRPKFYYSMTGNEDFLLDSFVDDIVGVRKSELNTDVIPRGHITFTSLNIMSDEFRNPNVWLRKILNNKSELKSRLLRIRALPVHISFDMEMKVSSQLDAFKCIQSMMDTLWIYQHTYFEYQDMYIDAFMEHVDNHSVEINRETSLGNDQNLITIKYQFVVKTYYPALREDRINLPDWSKETGGVLDMNSRKINGTVSDFFINHGASETSESVLKSRWYEDLLKVNGKK